MIKEQDARMDENPEECGRFSNYSLVVFAFVILGGAVFLVEFLTGRVVVEKPEISMIVMFGVVCLFGGALLGGALSNVRRCIVKFEWDSDGIAYHIGWFKPIVGRWSWSDPIQVRLFLSPTSSGWPIEQRPFLLVLKMGAEELKLNSMQIFWKPVAPFVNVLRRHVDIEALETSDGLVDQGPSFRRDFFFVADGTQDREK